MQCLHAGNDRVETAAMSPRQPAGKYAIETAEVFFLPSFCDVRMVFAVVVIAELLAFILTLVSPGVLENPWANLGLISVFMQWIALTSAALLCVCRSVTGASWQYGGCAGELPAGVAGHGDYQ